MTKSKNLQPIETFADGIRLMNTKGPLFPPVKLTRKRAKILLSMLHEYRHHWNRVRPEESDLDNDMQAATQWLSNQIYKRWSQAELYKD